MYGLKPVPFTLTHHRAPGLGAVATASDAI